MLAQETKEEVSGGFPTRFKKALKKGSTPRVVINLGTTDDYPYDGRMLNCQSMVRSAANKKGARQVFAEKGIPAPELHILPGNIPKNAYPVIGRTSYHSKGKGFWFCKNAAAVKAAGNAGATHFLRFIPKTREYRVHTFIKSQHQSMPPEERKADHYVSIKISEKGWTGETGPDPNEPQKNHTFGWVFMGPQNRSEEELNVVRHVAKNAIAALGMDFGAVDVMFHIHSKRPYVLEVNSTPSLADENADTCARYVQRFWKTIEGDKD
jgi:hypothetical protein